MKRPHPDYAILWEVNGPSADNHEENETDQMTVKSLMKFQCPESIEVYDKMIPGPHDAPDVKIRVYTKNESKPLPLIIDIHGGGFVSGDLDNDNNRIVRLMALMPCVVVSVAYRLAPANPFPAALEDCYAALNYCYEHPEEFGIDSSKIVINGYSAGGCIAAGLCLYARDKGGPKITAQVLNYPALDYLANSLSSLQCFENSALIKGEGLSDVWRLYLGGFSGELPSYYAVPSLCRDLSGLPATIVVVCEYDPLRDEGLDYARRLMQFAVPTEIYSLPRVPHGYDLVDAPMSKAVRQLIALSLDRELNNI